MRIRGIRIGTGMRDPCKKTVMIRLATLADTLRPFVSLPVSAKASAQDANASSAQEATQEQQIKQESKQASKQARKPNRIDAGKVGQAGEKASK